MSSADMGCGDAGPTAVLAFCFRSGYTSLNPVASSGGQLSLVIDGHTIDCFLRCLNVPLTNNGLRPGNMNYANKKRQFSLLRLLLAFAFVATAAGCLYWAQRLVLLQSGHDRLVAGLVFAIPSLLVGALFCLAKSFRNGIVAFVAIFGGIVVLAGVAHVVVPLLK
jgi:hypothetical protein